MWQQKRREGKINISGKATVGSASTAGPGD